MMHEKNVHFHISYDTHTHTPGHGHKEQPFHTAAMYNNIARSHPDLPKKTTPSNPVFSTHRADAEASTAARAIVRFHT
jgi:hypothetical protein